MLRSLAASGHVVRRTFSPGDSDDSLPSIFRARCCLCVRRRRPFPASAQFGGLIKKAKEKAAEKGAEAAADKAGDKMMPITPGEQLTDDLVGKVINGAQAADRMLGERDRVTAARETKNKEFSALLDKNQPVHAAYNEANSKIMSCRSSSFSRLEDARRKKYDAKVKEMQSDPALIGKVQLVSMKYAKAMADAQQKQDPVAT